MKASCVFIQGIIVLEPRVFVDERGFFFESYNSKTLAALGIDVSFVQDNHSLSRRGTLRGIHYQIKNPQAKLVRVVSGEVFDVSVDLRRSSPTFGRWFGLTLSAANMLQIYIPPAPEPFQVAGHAGAPCCPYTSCIPFMSTALSRGFKNVSQMW